MGMAASAVNSNESPISKSNGLRHCLNYLEYDRSATVVMMFHATALEMGVTLSKRETGSIYQSGV